MVNRVCVLIVSGTVGSMHDYACGLCLEVGSVCWKKVALVVTAVITGTDVSNVALCVFGIVNKM